MLSSPQNPQSRYFFDVPNPSNNHELVLNREVHLPQIAGHHCIGSSHGYLITINFAPEDSAMIHATNPLTGATLPLPTAPALPHLELGRGLYANRLSLYENPFFSADVTNNDKDKVEVDDKFKWLYKSRAILSPSLSTVLVHPGYGEMTSPLVARVGEDAEWNSSLSPHPIMLDSFFPNLLSSRMADCVFHRGCLHVLWEDRVLARVNIDGQPSLKQPAAAEFLHFETSFEDEAVTGTSSYLVESPSRDQLFLVNRFAHRDVLRFDVKKLCCDDEREGTYHRWNRVDCLEDLAIFVGHGGSFALYVPPNSPYLKPNCVYFTDDANLDNLCRPKSVGSTGVCDLGDGSIEFYRLTGYKYYDHNGVATVRDFNWPLPVWYMPMS